MKKFYISPLLLLIALLCLACDNDTSEIAPDSRIAPLNGKQLRIINNSSLQLVGEIYCFGADNNLTVNPSIRIKGRLIVPAGMDITYKNFMQSTNPNYAINTWYVLSNNSVTSTAYNASQTNQVFGQLFSPGVSAAKFANWRYLKVKLSDPSIEGFVPVTMMIDLPQYSPNNSEDRVVDLSAYGLPQYLHISQSSMNNTSGNTILTINSELINQ